MCDFSRRLVAWMDGELAENEATAVERHVGGCAECRERVAAYEKVSRDFATYHNVATLTALAAKTPRKLPRWVPVVAGASAAAVLIVLALLPLSPKQVSPVPQVAVATSPAALEASNAPFRPAAKRHLATHKKTPTASVPLAQPAVRIAIPAEEMFPPGAVPEGVSYIANLSLTSDGSVQGLRLQP
jgi:anti-sigma factor RsiW